jgi:hypothetical protein
MEGIPFRMSPTHAAVTRLLYLYRKFGSAAYLKQSAPTYSEALKLYVTERERISYSVLATSRLARMIPHATAAFCHFLFAEQDVDKAAQFFDALASEDL